MDTGTKGFQLIYLHFLPPVDQNNVQQPITPILSYHVQHTSSLYAWTIRKTFKRIDLGVNYTFSKHVFVKP